MQDTTKADKQFNKLKIRKRDGITSYYLIWYKNGKRYKKVIDLRYKNESIVSIRNRAITLFNNYKDIQEGIKEDPSKQIKITYDNLFVDYIVDCKSREVRKQTINQYQSIYDTYAKKHIGNIYVDELTRKDIKDVFRKISSKTKGQANKFLTFMVSSLNFGIDEEAYGLEFNVAQKIKKNPEQKYATSYTEKEKFLLFDELNKLENFKPGRIRSIAFIWLLILTGARKGEIAQAKRSWIKGNTIVIPYTHHKSGRKSGKDRIIYLSEHAMQIINKLTEVNPNEETITGIVSPQKTWNIIRKKCNVPHMRLHDLRHSFATYCLSAGLGHRQVGTLLGHQSLASMQRYGEVLADVSKKNVQLANDLILPQGLNS